MAVSKQVSHTVLVADGAPFAKFRALKALMLGLQAPNLNVKEVQRFKKQKKYLAQNSAEVCLVLEQS